MKLRCKECHEKERAPGRTRCYSCYGKARRGTPKPTLIDAADDDMRILFIDIETSPNLAYCWGLFKQNIAVNQIHTVGEIMCFAAKWYGTSENDMMFYDNRVDRLTMIDAAWKLLDEADVVVHYYGSEFDVKWLNREFLENGYTPPSPFKQVDLKKVCSRTFRFTSNKLQHVSTQLGLPGKEDHEGFPLWVKCMADEDEAWATMEAYNRQDVVLLEEVYEILLPWIPQHPNRRLYGGQGCPKCGSTEPMLEAGYAYTALSRFPQYECSNCGDYFRGGRRIDGVGIRESVK